MMNCKGKFILATNVDKAELSNADMLSSYKEMQGTERGFRFLKDSWFMASEVYLKKKSRIASLMMIMTLCLLVYNFTQHYIRSYLKNNNETLPNQKKKEVQNPTTRWIYQMIDYTNINVVRIKDISGNYREVVRLPAGLKHSLKSVFPTFFRTVIN